MCCKAVVSIVRVFLILMPGILLLLPSCGGTFGTLAWRSWEDEGARVTEIRSVGIEVRNIESYRSVCLGSRRTLYGTEYSEGKPEVSEHLPWQYGWCPSPEGPPLLLSQRTFGMEGGLEPSFTGIAVGINSRTVAVLPSDGTQVLYSTVDLDRPEASRIQLVTP